MSSNSWGGGSERQNYRYITNFGKVHWLHNHKICVNFCAWFLHKRCSTIYVLQLHQETSTLISLEFTRWL